MQDGKDQNWIFPAKDITDFYREIKNSIDIDKKKIQ